MMISKHGNGPHIPVQQMSHCLLHAIFLPAFGVPNLLPLIVEGAEQALAVVAQKDRLYTMELVFPSF